MELAEEGFGAIALAVLADPDAVVEGAGIFELGDEDGAEAFGLNAVGELGGGGDVGEGAELDAPASCGEWAFEADDFDADSGDALFDDAEVAGGGEGEIDDAPVDEGAAIVDDDLDGLAGVEVGDAH